MAILEVFKQILLKVKKLCISSYGENLISIAVFGSVGRGTPHQYSDIDMLIVCQKLPKGRIARIREFDGNVEEPMVNIFRKIEQKGIHVSLSPIIRTPGEIEQGSLLYLDMIQDAQILYDKEDFLHAYFQKLEKRLLDLGSKKIPIAGGWYWDLKPDYERGEIIEL